MSDKFTVFEWIPENEYFLKRLLRRLERMEDETWIEKRYGLLGGANPWNKEPAEDVLQQKIEAIATADSSYPDIKSFRFRGGTFNISNKVAFDYGRCVLYLCEGSGKVHPKDDLHILLYDRFTSNWYFCVTHNSTIETFLDWIQPHL